MAAQPVGRSVVATAGNGGAGSPDRLCQPRQPVAGARHHPRSRNRGTAGHRSVARPPHPAVDDRKPPACGSRRGTGTALVRHAEPVPGGDARHRREPAVPGSGPGSAHAHLYRGSGESDLSSVRLDAGVAGDSHFPGRRHEDEQPQPYREPRTFLACGRRWSYPRSRSLSFSWSERSCFPAACGICSPWTPVSSKTGS